MSAPIDLVLDRAGSFKLRANGRDRWRCVCPVCGEKNPNTLSMGVGNEGQVLLKCFKSGCDAESIAHGFGLELSDLFPPRESGSAPIKRRRLINASQALELLDGEMGLLIVCASDVVNGVDLGDRTRERLLQGAARVAMLRREVHS